MQIVKVITPLVRLFCDNIAKVIPTTAKPLALTMFALELPTRRGISATLVIENSLRSAPANPILSTSLYQLIEDFA